MAKVSIDRATNQAVAQLIAEQFDPEQIVLFGSHASATPAPTATSISSSSSNHSALAAGDAEVAVAV